jgi:hypothetical protein
MIMDNSFAIVDSVQLGNGYIAEAHDFQILPNGHYLLFGYYLTQVDMSQYVNGGYPAALVSGGVVQELDVDKNVVFQWRSWDYYDFADYPWGRRTTGEYVSAFHLNTINQDADGHIILATPSWNWKVNRQTGEVMWHCGGAMNEYSFIGVDSTDGISYITGHMFHRIPNGNFLVYDNGNRSGTKTSMAHEFTLDEENKTAELVWSYVPDSVVAGWHRGNAQRLPNGNTVIGWGGSSGKPSPAFTEVNASGERVYELSFDPPSIESYRAFRFPFTGGKPVAEVTIIEVQTGNSYEFSEGETNDTGINIDIASIEGTGYNELTVQKYEYAPLYPQFLGKAPRVQPQRMILSQYGLTGIEADIEFDVAKWNIKDPESTLVFHREFEGSGLFVALQTTYNHVTGKITATTQKFGEFILTHPDLASIVFTPALNAPADSGTVNQELPVLLRWNPVGYVNYYSLQIARDANFSDTVIDTSYMTDAVYTMQTVDTMTTYYWRVKAYNDAGSSDWTDTRRFLTVKPFVSVAQPNGGEEWQVGLDYYIRWEDNLAEDVVLMLYRGDLMSGIIDTVKSMGAYEWEIPVDLETGENYLVKIKSIDNDQHVGQSAAFFMIMDTTASAIEDQMQIPQEYVLEQNYPNPFNPQTEIRFSLPAQGHAYLNIFDITGRKVAKLLDRDMSPGIHSVTWYGKDVTGINIASGIYFYQLQVRNTTGELQYHQTRKMILIR